MKRASRRTMALALAAGLTAGWGCGDGAPSVETSTAEATVQGKVTFNGKPVTKGEVTFDPSNHLRKNATTRSAALGADGTYTATTLVGANQVFVNSPELRKTEVGTIEYDVRAGDNTLDIALPRSQ
ncbi:hypothetical protein [Paludisphaera sp.]|uniref:hypothetical protein n=1 Tax=Paludisphaera sp. TaxID=2017432 RepID=UPI00301D0F8C